MTVAVGFRAYYAFLGLCPIRSIGVAPFFSPYIAVVTTWCEEIATQAEGVFGFLVVIVEHINGGMQRATPYIYITHVAPCKVTDEIVVSGILTEQGIRPTHSQQCLLIIIVLGTEQILIVI